MRNLIKTTTPSYFTNRDGISKMYLNEIKDFVILEEKEILNLLEKSKKGDKKSIEMLVKSYQRFILAFAKRFCKNNESVLCELISEGNIGLLKSIDGFDQTKKTKFLTYAVWYIQKYMYMYLATKEPMILISNYNKTASKLKKISNEFILTNGRQPDSLELIDILSENYNIEVKDEVDVYNLDIISLNFVDNEKNDCDTEFKYCEMWSENTYEKEINQEYSKQTINSLMVFLSPKEQEVIKLLYGIDSFRPLELTEVAEKFNMTDDGIKCIKVRALNKMKNNFKTISKQV